MLLAAAREVGVRLSVVRRYDTYILLLLTYAARVSSGDRITLTLGGASSAVVVAMHRSFNCIIEMPL